MGKGIRVSTSPTTGRSKPIKTVTHAIAEMDQNNSTSHRTNKPVVTKSLANDEEQPHPPSSPKTKPKRAHNPIHTPIIIHKPINITELNNFKNHTSSYSTKPLTLSTKPTTHSTNHTSHPYNKQPPATAHAKSTD